MPAPLVSAPVGADALTARPDLQRALTQRAATEGTSDLLTADPAAWLAQPHRVSLICRTSGAERLSAARHVVTVTDGQIHATDHDPRWSEDVGRIMVALGEPAPTCIRLAHASTDQQNAPHPRLHTANIVPVPATAEMLTFLATAQQFLLDDPTVAARLPDLDPVLSRGAHPATWRAWSDAGFTPEQAAQCWARGAALPHAAAWAAHEPFTTRTLGLAASAVTPAQHQSLLDAGLHLHEADHWAHLLPTFTVEQVVHLAHRTTHTPATAVAAHAAVGWDAAARYGRAGLTVDTHDTGTHWWDVTGSDLATAASFNSDGLDPDNAAYLIVNAAASDPATVAAFVHGWTDAGCRTMEELLGLVRCGIPAETVPAAATLRGPDGHLIPMDRAARLCARTTTPEQTLARTLSVAPAPGARCGVPHCSTDGCTAAHAFGHGLMWDGAPDISSSHAYGHPMSDPARLAAIDTLIAGLGAPRP